jgi:glycine hydroxymethyltransferase
MDAVRTNAQALGEALVQRGVPCVSVDGRFSESHCLLARVAAFGAGAEVASRLEEAGMITTSALLPAALGSEGIRIGVQEITRRGADQATMAQIARLFADAVTGGRPLSEIASDAGALAASLGSIRFSLE